MPSSHLRKVFDPETLRRVARESERLRVEHGADIVVVRGLSGTLAASAMGAMFGTPFAVARKPNEISHGQSLEVVDGIDGDDCLYKDWIIVDDLIASGNTVRAIREAVGRYDHVIRGRCKGIILYHWDHDSEYDLGAGYVVPVFFIREKVQR